MKKKRYYLKKYRIFNLWSKFQTNRSLHRSWFHGILWTLAFPKTPFKPGLGRAVDWHERRTKLTRITSTNRAVRLHRLVNVSAMPINHLAPVSIRRTTPYRHQSSRLTTFSISNLHQWFTFPLLSELFHNFFFFYFFPILFRYPLNDILFFFFLSHCEQNSSKLFHTIFFNSFLILSRCPNDLSFDNIPSQRFNFSKLSHDSFPPFSLDSKRYFSWYFVST